MGLTPALTQNGEIHIDGGACCFAWRQICAVAEERLTRRKHDGGAAYALRAVLADCGIQLDDVSGFYVSTCGERIPGPGAAISISEDGLLGLRDIGVPVDKIHWVPSHHLSHAHVAFELSGFEQALVVVMDDAGSAPPRECFDRRVESRCEVAGELERVSCFLADRDAGYQLVAQIRAERPLAGACGSMYRYMTDFLALNGMTECGKTMALAAYGRPGAFSKLQLLERRGIGHVTRLAKPPTESVEAVRELLSASGYEHVAPRSSKNILLNVAADLARHAQEELEDAVLTMVRELIATQGVTDLCLSGGVALNCVLVGKIANMPEVGKVYVPAAPGDTGQPLGNCLYGARQAGMVLPRELIQQYLGPRYSLDRVRRACEAWGSGLPGSRGHIARKVAKDISRGKVVAVYHGRSEVGPRALGHRSILADPRDTRMRDYLNGVVKVREPYRPYGAAVLEEHTERLFGRRIVSPFMMMALPLTKNWQERIPAVCHVDGTSRVQTIGADESNWFRNILEEFHALTGVPVILNTSFNSAGEPIVETPEDALTAFLTMELDAIAIEEWYLEKPTCRAGHV